MQRIKDLWNKNKSSKIILIIIGGLIVSCFACSVFAILLPESEELSLDPTATNEPATATDIPAIEQVARTQIAETVVAAITQTIEAEATQTPTDEPISEVEEYSIELSIKGLMCGTSLDTMGQKFIEAGGNLELLNDSNYLASMFADIDDFELNCTNFYDENAPVEFTEMNNILKEVDENYIQTVINLRSGLITMDADKLDMANYYMNVRPSPYPRVT